VPVDGGDRALPGDADEPVRSGGGQAATVGVGDDGSGEWMLGLPFHRRGQPQQLVLVGARRDHDVGHGQALAGDHRLVHVGLAGFDHAVHGDLPARVDEQQVADHHLGRRDLDRRPAPHDQSPLRRQLEQGADRVVRTTTGAHLEPVTQQHEGRQHAGRLVEDVTAAGEGDHGRVGPAGTDRDGDQHHHVQRPGAQRPDRAVEGRLSHCCPPARTPISYYVG